MVRPGHHRPLGTTATMRFCEWRGERLPELGDVACQASGNGTEDEDYVRRAYRIVGILEGRDRAHFKLVMERVEWGTLPDSLDPDAIWSFYNVPR